MRKLLLLLVAASSLSPAIAQERNVTSANMALQRQNFDDAKTDIDQAYNDPDTKDQPKMLLVYGETYLAIQSDPKYQALSPYRNATTAFLRLHAMKPDYNKEEVVQGLSQCFILYFNDAVTLYNQASNNRDAAKYQSVVDLLNQDINIAHAVNLNSTKSDTLMANVALIKANSYYYGNRLDSALPMLIQVKDNPITRTTTAYYNLVELYQRQNKDDELIATLKEARKYFPNDENLRNDEMNYYIKTGKTDAVLQNLNDAIAKDPNNADLYLNLGTIEENEAFPASGKLPPNHDDLVKNAEAAYKHAISLSPENAAYNYSLGALYYNIATVTNDQMNAITGTGSADQARYDGLKKQRDAMFAEALAPLEKVYSMLEPQAATIKGADRDNYHSTLNALRQIYALQNKMDKAAEMRKKLEELK